MAISWRANHFGGGKRQQTVDKYLLKPRLKNLGMHFKTLLRPRLRSEKKPSEIPGTVVAFTPLHVRFKLKRATCPGVDRTRSERFPIFHVLPLEN
jgi:hypothetical protein